MELQKSNYMEGKFRRLIPRKQINEGWHYYKLHGSDNIIATRVILGEVYFVTEKGGQPVINPNLKTHIFEWNQSIESKILTKQQYEDILESKFEDEN